MYKTIKFNPRIYKGLIKKGYKVLLSTNGPSDYIYINYWR